MENNVIKRKLLIVSDTPTISSGLAHCTRELAALLSAKYEVAIAGWHQDPVPHSYPYFIYQLDKGYASENRQMSYILKHFMPDFILSIGDMWDFINYINAIIEHKEQNKCFWVVWATIDGENLNLHWNVVVRNCDKFVSFTNFGAKEIEIISQIKPDVIYPGINQKKFFVDSVKTLRKGNIVIDPDKIFTILNVSQNTDRKNIPASIETFSRFAEDKNDVILLLVTDPMDPNGYDLWRFIKKFKIEKKVAIAKNAGPTRGMGINDLELNLLYNTANVLLLSSIGEGFGLPLLEAMSTRTIPVSTDYAATTELLSGNRGILIPPRAFIYGTHGIKRAIIDNDVLLDKLDEVYLKWREKDDSLKKYMESGRKFANELTWEKTADKFNSIFQDFLKDKPRSWVKNSVKVKDLNLLMVIPSWGKNCGIAEYTKNLIEAIRGTGNTITIFPNNDFNALRKFANEDRPDFNVIHFQHEFSFFEDVKFLDILKRLRDKRLIVTLHSILPKKTSYNKRLLNRADEVLVHSEFLRDVLLRSLDTVESNKNLLPQINNLRFIGMGSKPMAKEDYGDVIRERLNISDRWPIIGSFGFLREQKGFEDLALAIKDMIPLYPKILLYLYAPPHEFGSGRFDESFMGWIEKIGMQDYVLMIRDYASDEKMIQCLQAAHMFVLNYKNSIDGGGISSAIKTLMRTSRPVLSTDSFMFSDLVGGEVVKIRNPNPPALVNAINSLLKNKTLQDNLVENAHRFLINNSWDSIARKHLDIYYG